jgi:hypothetical protein
MSPKHLSGPLMAGLVIGAAAILAGCAAATPDETPPALIKPVAGSQIPQLQLTERAVQRLGIVTQPVRPTTTAGQPTRQVALLSAGPAAGTPVVTVGAAELLGTEYNISGEE